MTDPNAQLAFLRTQRDLAPDAAIRAMFEQLITSLEAQSVPAQTIAGSSEVGVAVAGDVRGAVVAPLFPEGASGNYIAGVLNLYQPTPAAPPADYDAALRRYLKHLYSLYATLDLRGIDDRPMDMPLSEIYVSLNLHEPPPDDLRGRGALRGFIEKTRGLVGRADAELDAAGRPKPVDWKVALRHSRLAVIGAPGAGKTTLLHYTAVRLCEVLARDDRAQLIALGLTSSTASNIAVSIAPNIAVSISCDDRAQLIALGLTNAAQPATEPPVPLLLPLRELGSFLGEAGAREASGANARLLLDCLANYYQRADLNLPPDFFSRLCDAGRAILLLDGLDEVVKSDDRVFVSAIVRNFAQRYASCRYVVTARVAAYQGDAQIGAGFHICTVADLDADQQQRFIGNWSRSLHQLLYNLRGDELAQAAARYSDELWHALEQNARVRDLATNPLLLTVVAVIFHNNYVLPEDRAALYEECVEVLLRGGRGKADRPAQQRVQYGGTAELSMGLKPKRELLAEVAYTMHQRGEEGVIISHAELVRLVAAHLHHHPDAAAAAQAFVDELPVHIGLLDEREPDRYRFSHLSFQEFLAARHIAEATEARWDELLAHYQESWWREVILLCAGHLSQARCWTFLERLIGLGGTHADRAAALGLATDALAELERFKGQGPLNARITADALAILKAPALVAPAAARVICGRVLARLGDPRPGVCTLPPDMLPIAGGSFVLGNTKEEYHGIIAAEQRGTFARYAKDWYEDTVNSQSVQLATFELARYPITNAQYALFMADHGYNLSHPWWDAAGRAWLARDDATTPKLQSNQRRRFKDQPEWWDDERYGQARPNHPVVGISWYEAIAFCRWLTQSRVYNPDGHTYTLPSEAEWEYAARGLERRPYPWGGDEPDGERANCEQIYTGTTAVGCFPRGATEEGLLDMDGNVSEWTRSEYRSYPYDPDDGREATDEPAKKRFTLRGGSWNNQSISLRASRRGDGVPDYHRNIVGLRLARHRKV